MEIGIRPWYLCASVREKGDTTVCESDAVAASCALPMGIFKQPQHRLYGSRASIVGRTTTMQGGGCGDEEVGARPGWWGWGGAEEVET
ncbi:hypothetical protein E2562_003976 [Oryza meyeriana var. granulata]|uniref:Uncharacterized protein n=1 Tax=Oryza meyeriana var. granulata TaxID=110450 RepID=A0A6G1BJZ7_9ORYZ|nr:hypothetical protein E2562_003976 [Oryza meyeriana var. granulata]